MSTHASAPALQSITALALHPLAHAKYMFLCRACRTEIGLYCVTHPDNSLYIVDFVAPKQECTAATFDFDPLGLPDIYDHFEERGIPVERFNRIIAHTHPGNSATPSSVDWTSFREPTRLSLGHWGMLILARGGEMTFNLGLAMGENMISLSLPVKVLDEVSLDDFIGDLSRENLVENLGRVTQQTRQLYQGSYSGPGAYQGPNGTGFRGSRAATAGTDDAQLIGSRGSNRKGNKPGKEGAAAGGKTGTAADTARNRLAARSKTSTKKLSDGSSLTLVSQDPLWDPEKLTAPKYCARITTYDAFAIPRDLDVTEGIEIASIYGLVEPGYYAYPEKLALDLVLMTTEISDLLSVKDSPLELTTEWCNDAWTICRAYLALPMTIQLDVDNKVREAVRTGSCPVTDFAGTSALRTGDDCCVWLMAGLRRYINEQGLLIKS